MFSPKLLQPLKKKKKITDYRPGTINVSFSAVSNGLLLASTKEKNVALIEDMKGDCLAYVAYCCFELATESFQVYQQCKK